LIGLKLPFFVGQGSVRLTQSLTPLEQPSDLHELRAAKQSLIVCFHHNRLDFGTSRASDLVGQGDGQPSSLDMTLLCASYPTKLANLSNNQAVEMAPMR
jgi:hypothetical protein